MRINRWLYMLLFLVCISISVQGCNKFRPLPKILEEVAAAQVTIDGVKVEGLNAAQVRALLIHMALKNNINSEKARFDDAGVLQDEKVGRIIDVEKTVFQVLRAPANSTVTISYRSIAPELTAEGLRKAVLLGGYRTVMVKSTSEREKNIKLTCRLINNAVVEAGQEFSFNRRVGEPTGHRGFYEAPILVDGQKQALGLGGGMCQVSSTLYNAVLAAGLPVVERHPHSQPVQYVPKNCDATTYTDKDFRFRNSTRQDLILRAFVKGQDVIVEIYQLASK